MKLLLLLIALIAINLATADESKCYDSKEECHSTNYQTYVDCVRKRQKRSLCESSCDNGNCINTCNECDCNSCNYNNCQNSCSSCCNSCCSNYVPCHTNHCCHKTCHAQCSTSACRSSCRRNCFDSVKEKSETIINNSGGEIGNTNITNLNRHNVTTIIHLNNIINNTNVIDVPIVLNNTNQQNITLVNEGSSTNSKSTERCCSVISPRQCVSTPTPRCFHYRSKQCGPFCTADIVHKEHQQICQTYYPGAPPQCSQQVLYIPQPQPKCTYQSFWPYVSCGIQKEQTCQGCYSHYVNPQSSNYLTCPPQCYDDGFGMGSLYRQGPVYRPMYSHVPCYNCMNYPPPFQATDYSAGMGGYPGGVGYSAYPGGVGYSAYPGGVGYSAYPGGAWYPGVPNINTVNNSINQIPVLDVDGVNPPLEQLNKFVIEPGQIIQGQRQIIDDRLPREVEIEVKYQPSTDAQAEVKIQKRAAEELVVDILPNKDIEIIDIIDDKDTKLA